MPAPHPCCPRAPTPLCARERERERRLESREAHGFKKSKLTRDRDRDISEKIALGMAKVSGLFSRMCAWCARLVCQVVSNLCFAHSNLCLPCVPTHPRHPKPLF